MNGLPSVMPSVQRSQPTNYTVGLRIVSLELLTRPSAKAAPGSISPSSGLASRIKQLQLQLRCSSIKILEGAAQEQQAHPGPGY